MLRLLGSSEGHLIQPHCSHRASVASPMLNGGEVSPPTACWQHSASYSPGHHKPSLPQRHISGSCSSRCPFLQSCFPPSGTPQHILVPGGCIWCQRTLHFPLLHFIRLLSAHFLQTTIAWSKEEKRVHGWDSKAGQGNYGPLVQWGFSRCSLYL